MNYDPDTDSYSRNSSSKQWVPRVGEVGMVTTMVVAIDISVDPMEVHYSDDADYVIKVNGRVIKRMNAFQAIRLGIVNVR
jgi:hypothetical protein